jgi:outer membrane lipoprotein carrier protein
MNIAWLGLALLAGLRPPTETATAAEVAARLENRLAGLRTLQARFSQVYYGPPPSVPLSEKGVFYFEKPSRMRWHYGDPEPKDYLYKDGLFYSYYPDDNQLIIRKLSGEYHEAELLRILAGEGRLRDDYDLELESVPASAPAGTRILKLKPKAPEEASSEILIEVNGASGLIRRAVFRDWTGNSSEFSFEDIRPDRKLDPGLFELKVPDGCEIIRDEDAPRPGKQTNSAAVRIPG